MIKLSLNQAAKEAGIAKKTILESIKKGRLSAPKNEKGHYEIDPAELFRVYPKPETHQVEKPIPTPIRNQYFGDKTSVLEAELNAVREKLEMVEKLRDREREKLVDEIEDLRRRLDTETAERRSLTAQLTDQRKPPQGLFKRLFG